MTRARWHAIESLFGQALDRPPEARGAWLKTACGDDALRAEVAALLAECEEAGVVDRLADALAAPLAAPRAAAPGAAEGRRIGPYRVERLLGQGGMGAVYLAARDDGQFEQEVALKVVREGLDTPTLRTRFLHERQTLARLQHPGIARLLDGGLTDDGRPFFALEHVEGQRLDRYCDEHRLDVPARLRLFGQVCEAVHYAHQHLVVHRDLKPGNILVTENGGGSIRPHVKLLDFGIAKLLEDPDGAADAPQTVTHAMTPAYAAPEQVRGEPVTTATDVYSLGVILYELLSGHRPFTVGHATPAEWERLVCETDPSRPSVASAQSETIGGDGRAAAATPEAVAAARGTTPDALGRRLSGDLDTICLKALEKEPGRRYTSAEALLDDVKRYLAGLPIEARPASAGYRARLFVRRHRLGVTAAVLVLLSLVAGLAGTAWQAQEAAQERDRAQAETVKAEEALDLLVALFEQADPGATAGETLTAREVLDRAEERLRTFDGPPAVEATLLDALGRVYQNLGLYDRAGVHLERALGLRRALHPTPHAEHAASLHHLGRLRSLQDRFDEADSLYRAAATLYDVLPASDDLARAAVLHDHASVLRQLGRTAEAEPLVREALTLRRDALGPTHPDVGASLFVLASCLHDVGNYTEAETLFQETIALYQSGPDTLHPDAADARYQLAQFYLFRGTLGEAEQLAREALALRRRLYGDTHPDVAFALELLGTVRYQQEHLDEAETLINEALDVGARTLGPDHPDLVPMRQQLGLVYQDREAFDAAIETFTATLDGYRRHYGDDYLPIINVLSWRGYNHLWSSDLRAATADFEEALARSRARYGDEHALVGRSLQGLAAVTAQTGDAVRAEALYGEALALFLRVLRPDHTSVGRAKQGLALLLIEQERFGEAEVLLREALPVFASWHGDEHSRVLTTTSALGEALTGLGRYDEAASLLAGSYATLLARYGPDHSYVQAARRRFDALPAAYR